MKISLYESTGFSAVDIPDSIDIIKNNFQPVLVDTDVDLIQNNYLAYIIVDMLHNIADKVDYVIVEESELNYTCYTVENYEELAPQTIKFNLLIDPYNSIGGLGANSGNMVVSGSANRLTVSVEEDNTNFYVLPEPFEPSEKFKNIFNDLNRPSDDTKMSFVETLTIPPQTVEAIIKEGSQTLPSGVRVQSQSNADRVYKGASVADYTLETEQSTSAGTIKSFIYGKEITTTSRKLVSTKIKINRLNGTQTEIETETRYWTKNHNNTDYEIVVDGKTIKGDLVKDFRDNGRDSDIVNFWEMPLYYFSIIRNTKYSPVSENAGEQVGHLSEPGGISAIQNKIINTSLSISPINVYNNKARYSQSISIKIYNSCAGTELNKNVYEIVNIGTMPNQQAYNADIIITADIRPNGAPLFAFKYLNGASQLDNPIEVLNGANWRSISLMATGVSNVNYENAQINKEASRNKGEALGTGIVSLLQMVGGVALMAGGAAVTGATGGTGAVAGVPLGKIGATLLTSGAAGAVSSGLSYLSSSVKQRDQQEMLQRRGITAGSELIVGNSNFIRECGYNYFSACITSYSDNDMVAYDTFLTRFGYNVGNKLITNHDFYSRPKFNYVRINDITIESLRASLEMLEKVKQQLKAGVRIWHTKPNPQDMLAGGNR